MEQRRRLLVLMLPCVTVDIDTDPLQTDDIGRAGEREGMCGTSGNQKKNRSSLMVHHVRKLLAASIGCSVQQATQ